MKVTEDQVKAACEVAARVHRGELKRADGVRLLVDQHGVNEASAGDYIYDYRCLMEGKEFHRAMSVPAMRHFLEQIRAEHGEAALANAIKSLRAHIRYYEGYTGTRMHQMRELADEFARDEQNASEEADPAVGSYLLTWNPEHFKFGGDQGVVVGREHRWTCHSKQPREGDRVYLIRLGVEPRGIVASGTVTAPAEEGPHWRDETKVARYIKFMVEQFRPDTASGLLPIVLLEQALPHQRWSAQNSGIAIARPIEEKLRELWEAGAGHHALRQYVDWSRSDPVARRPNWLRTYNETVALAAALRENPDRLDEKSLERLWRPANNGVSGVGPGAMSTAEFEANKSLLIEFTHEILSQPTASTLSAVETRWQKAVTEGAFAKLRTAVIRRVFSAAAPGAYTTILREADCQRVLGVLGTQFQLTPPPSPPDWAGLQAAIVDCMREAGIDSTSATENNIAMWGLAESLIPASEPEPGEIVEDDIARIAAVNATPTNLILYGPPGTGKTYAVIDEAIAILAPELLEGEPDRETLKARFDELVLEGRIVFTTFHQSFSYEDFVEGIRAETDDAGHLSYRVVSGVFRTLCEERTADLRVSSSSREASLFAAGEAFGGYIVERSTPDVLELRKPSGKLLPIGMSLLNELAALVRAGRIEIDDIKEKRVFDKVPDTELEPHLVNGYFNLLPSIVRSLASKVPSEREPAGSRSGVAWPRVLIIDEINRGNISRIFGELITLIEASKRAGMPEALEVVLPYSKKRFSVPAHLHIIGTMNTADRSLVGLDVALRRRFEFREMPPRPDLLDDLVIEEVPVGALLRVLNERIELLLDRDHRLGHAFLLPLRQTPNLSRLAHVFRSNILPLLQEYFFDDWERVRWVLNDHRKPEALQFVQVRASDASQVFGPAVPSTHQSTRWMVNDEAFDKAQAYLGTLQVND